MFSFQVAHRGAANGMSTTKDTLNILWIADLESRHQMRHGGVLRCVNLSRGLTALGHRVYFLVTNNHNEDLTLRRSFLDGLRNDDVLTDYFEFDVGRAPKWRAKLARVLVHPLGRNWIMSPARRRCKAEVLSLLDQYRIDLCIFSDRYDLFLIPEFARRAPTLVDWCDSFVLTLLRDIRVQLRNHRAGPIPAAIKDLIDWFMIERFYGRKSAGNLAASPADKACLDVITGRPRRTYVLPNGVSFPTGDRERVPKIAGRLIFTGTMSFPPNHQAAMWFIQRVMPSVEQARGDVRFVVVGQNPCDELRAAARQNVIVTGLVPDLRQEIASSQLYVAPLISGSGFKNKIVEAIASGTFVAATRMAVESLGERLQQLLLVADSADDLARKILRYLEDPERFDERLREAREIVKTEFAWERRVGQLLDVCREMISARPGLGAGNAGET
jgi:glycosyltransferase involved in cell wall biosynthesis